MNHLLDHQVIFMHGSRPTDLPPPPPDPPPPPPHTHTQTPEKSQNTGILSNTGPDCLKITKLPNQHSILGHHLIICTPAKHHEMAFHWCAVDSLLIVVFGSSPHHLKKIKVGHPLPNFLDQRMILFICFYLF